MTEPIISVRNLVKIYKTKKVRFKALNGIDLDIYPGEFAAVAGTSGSGKSTLLNLIAGLEKPTAGKIFVKEKPVHKMKEDDLVEFRLNHIGFIFQNFNLMDTLTTLENAAFPLMLCGLTPREREQKAREVLSELGLSKHLAHDTNELSGGQQQRVSIARAIISKPEILFADEPTGNLDSETAGQIMEVLRDIVRENGTTLLMVTHDMEKARYADRIVYLTDGDITKIEGGQRKSEK
ncbi:ABC transporter ATP-binding protein [Christensenella hongkongensis]|uniref:Methionine ABC transporter ATP-binding protein n=1 Tax=Christensenella hongkongensis TaxID=270498 RepID=A0A0M2NDY9_9FIRM|nr:ABC transporter ATP-binding protein [Christensenella hongkongensis]KKI50739.1 Methionine ABC transporter ATP-binding protein [Christensenella hongkongensis]TCW30660.1 putative ABC transport system ATP-binding protein [Christensenella hongkongensis]